MNPIKKILFHIWDTHISLDVMCHPHRFSYILMAFLMLNPPGISGMNSSRCWRIILFTYCHIPSSVCWHFVGFCACVWVRQAHHFPYSWGPGQLHWPLGGKGRRTHRLPELRFTPTRELAPGLRLETVWEARPLAVTGHNSSMSWTGWAQQGQAAEAR